MRIYGANTSDDNKKEPKKVKASFQGALSVGVDAITNTVIVSAQDEWMESIEHMIQTLDQQAEPYAPTVAVHMTSGAINTEALQAALAKALGQPASASPEGGQRPQDQQQQQPGQEANPQAGSSNE